MRWLASLTLLLTFTYAGVSLMPTDPTTTRPVSPRTEVEKRKREIETMARTMWGEARSEGDPGMAAVAWVLMNRADKRRTSPSREATRRKQFSAWNENDPNREKMLRVTAQDPNFARALQIAAQVYNRSVEDPTEGATHYVTNQIVDRVPWAADMDRTAVIGNHTFLTPASKLRTPAPKIDPNLLASILSTVGQTQA